MKRRTVCKAMMAAAGGTWLLQITACLGSDPEFFVASAVSSTIIANVVTLVFNALTGALVA
jgi:hypothetical protein